MAPLFQRVLLLLGLLCIGLSTPGEARVFDRGLVSSADTKSLQLRATVDNINWPCLPDKRKPNKSVKDPGAAVGKLLYTAAMVRQANEQHAGVPSNATTTPVQKAEAEQTETPDAFQKRLNGVISQLAANAAVSVPTDESRIIYWQAFSGNIENLVMAISDLSGCTVVIVSSPHVAIMAHVWERREQATWLWDPTGSAQQAKDAEFVTQGSWLLDQLLLSLGGTVLNNYNGWLPVGSTKVHVVAPAMNPDYPDGPNGNPWYTSITDQGLIYENAAKNLLSMAAFKVADATGGDLLTYRRRWSNDPMHGLDDRDKIVLVPYVMDGHTFLHMMFDDNKLVAINQIN